MVSFGDSQDQLVVAGPDEGAHITIECKRQYLQSALHKSSVSAAACQPNGSIDATAAQLTIQTRETSSTDMHANALEKSSSTHRFVEALYDDGGASALLGAMTAHMRNPDLVGSCLRALHRMCASPTLVERLVGDLKVGFVLLLTEAIGLSNVYIINHYSYYFSARRSRRLLDALDGLPP